MYREGNICTYFNNGYGICTANGSRCDSPFSCEGCKIQCERIFKKEFKKGETLEYKPTKDKIIISKSEAWKRIGIKKDDLIADYFIPYFDFDRFAVSPSVIIDDAYKTIDEKIKRAGFTTNNVQYRLYQNVGMLGQIGVYVIGVIRHE